MAGMAVIGAIAGAGCSAGSPQDPATPTSSVHTSDPGHSQGSTSPALTPGLPAPTTTAPMVPNPNGDGSMVPCEGTICTNPNHGGGDNPDGDAPPEPGQTDMQG
jgi:hypothetical protein